jgi:hypothetical protein
VVTKSDAVPEIEHCYRTDVEWEPPLLLQRAGSAMMAMAQPYRLDGGFSSFAPALEAAQPQFESAELPLFDEGAVGGALGPFELDVSLELNDIE